MIAKRRNKDRRWRNPMVQLVTQMRIAAAQIHLPPARKVARREADTIAQTFSEKMPNTIKGQLAKHGRILMRQLPDLSPDDYKETASLLRFIADLLEERGTSPVVHESILGGRKHV